MRTFATFAGRLQKASANVRALRLRPPQEPLVKDVKVPENHPLWQFFGENREYLRSPDDVKDKGEPWSIPQLRRKSFEDLHTIWHVSLKEWNKLAREAQIVHMWSSEPGKDTLMENRGSAFDEVIGKVRTTMWRVRHVLAERYHAHKWSEIELKESYPALLSEFSKDYLEADSNADGEVTNQLERFQYAFFGINPLLEDNVPDQKILQGLYVVARLKLLRYASEQTRVTTVNNVREAFLLFSSEHTPEGIADSISLIEEMRQRESDDSSQSSEPETDEIVVLAELMLKSAADLSESTPRAQ